MPFSWGWTVVPSKRQFTSANRASNPSAPDSTRPIACVSRNRRIDWIDVITPFHRVELAAEMNARSGRRMFSQQDASDVLKGAANQIDLLIEMSLHPLNTFVAVPPYQVQLMLSGGRRVEPQRVERFPRFGPRPESAGPALPSASTCVWRRPACCRGDDSRRTRRIDARAESADRSDGVGRKN